MTPETNPYEPKDLIESSKRALAAWDQKTAEEKIAALKRYGLLDTNGDLHPDYEWTPERYAQEFGQGHAAK